MSEANMRAREAVASTALPGTPTQDDGGGLSPAAGNPASAPSITELLAYLHAQNVRMENMMQMMQHDRHDGTNNRGSHLANVRLEEKRFRNVQKSSVQAGKNGVASSSVRCGSAAWTLRTSWRPATTAKIPSTIYRRIIHRKISSPPICTIG